MCFQKSTTFFFLILLSISGCQKERETTVRVSSIAFWTDTDIDLHIGQSVVIQATGEVYGRYTPPERVWGPLGPEGQTDEIADSLWMLPGVPKITLLAKIGEDGEPFEVGSEMRISAERQGRLFLGVNDRVYLHPQDHHYKEGVTQQMHTGCYEDNKGEFTAKITFH